jgi:hypothetical protein
MPVRPGHLLLLFGLSAQAAETKPDVVFEWPGVRDHIVDVDPGESARRTLLIRNEGASPSPPRSLLFTQQDAGGRLGVDYHFETLTPAVCSSTQAAGRGARMTIESIPALTEARCIFDVRRNADSLHDNYYVASNEACIWSPIHSTCFNLRMELGSHPDLALVIVPTAPVFVGDTEAIVRATVANPSDLAIASPGFGACTTHYFPRFQWSTDIEDGCDDDFSPPCFGSGYGFLVPDVPPRGQSSCLIKLTFPPIRTSNVVGLELQRNLTSLDRTRLLLDPRMANGQGAFGVIPMSREPAIVPIRRHTLALLVFLLLIPAAVRLLPMRHE